MTKIMKGGVAYNTTSNMVALTQAEYNSLSTAQKNNGNFYFIVDSDPSYFSAENIDYDNTDSSLTATSVQDAIDEVVSEKATKSWTYIDTIVSGDSGCNLSGYSEVLIVPYANNNTKYNSFVYPLAEVNGAVISIVGSTTHKYVGIFTLNSSNILTVANSTISVWTSCYMRIWAR